MTKQDMNAKLNRKDLNGIGVEVVTATGFTLYYFYEDSNEEGEGIDRAMHQLYPGLQDGRFKRVTFIERAQ